MLKTIQTPGIYESAHLHICSIYLRHYVSLLTETQYLHVEPSDKGTHTIENMMLKMFFICTDSSDEQSVFVIICLFISFFEFTVEWIPAIKNKAEIIFSSKYHLHYCNYW